MLEGERVNIATIRPPLNFLERVRFRASNKNKTFFFQSTAIQTFISMSDIFLRQCK